MVQYELSLVEIGGHEPVDQIYPGQITDADAILLVFSLGSPDAIQQLRFYQATLTQIASDVPMFLVGMKSDTGGSEGEQLLINQIENMARNWGIRGFWKTSVFTGLNALRLLTAIAALPVIIVDMGIIWGPWVQYAFGIKKKIETTGVLI